MNKMNIPLNQASSLRDLRRPQQGIKVVAVTGGKGGVGKSNVTLNVGMSLAAQGKRVLVLDADLGLANIDVMLGLRVHRNLSNVLSGECSLDDIIVHGPNGLMIIPATSGTQSMVELSTTEHAGLIRAFSTMQTPIDMLLVDTAAGISDMVLSFSRAAQDVIVVVCDEPASITDAYALIKILSKEHGIARFRIVANMVRSLREGQELYSKLTRVTDRFLDATLELVACIPYDNNVRLSMKKQRVIVDAFPKSPAALAFRALANQVSQWPIPQQPGGHLEFFIESLLNKPSVGGGIDDE